MRIPNWLCRVLARRVRRRIDNMIPDQWIGNATLIKRFNLWSNRFFCVRAHEFVGSDDREYHDHPWWNISVVLDGAYYEIEPRHQVPPGYPQCTIRNTGDVICRADTYQHRIVLMRGYHTWYRPTLTLFIHRTRQTRRWGFYDEGGRFLRYGV